MPTHALHKVGGNSRTFIFDRIYSAKLAIVFNIRERKKILIKATISKSHPLVSISVFLRGNVFFHPSGSTSG